MTIDAEPETAYPVLGEPAPRRWPGRAALILALATVVLVVAATNALGSGSLQVVTDLSVAGIATSVLAVAGGVVAAAKDWNRRSGVAAIVIGVLANPLVLLLGLQLTGRI